jgi:Uma2 family endonuclease
MSVPASHRPVATAADLAALPQDVHAEVIAGEIVEKAAPSFEHSDAQGGLSQWLRNRFHRGGAGGSRPGGWWIVTECEIELEAHEVYRPDLVGWRRSEVPTRPSGRPVRVRPDWVCEMLSPSNAGNDLVKKFRAYHRCKVPHYWIVDPEGGTLVVYRWQEGGYLAVVTATRGETVRAEPFDAVALPVGILFGEDEPE